MAPLLWQFAEFEFDETTYELRREGKLLRLEGKPKDVLLLLLRNAGKVVSRSTIEKEVWKNTYIGKESVPVAVSKLRAVLRDNGSQSREANGGAEPDRGTAQNRSETEHEDRERDRIIRSVINGGYIMNVEVLLRTGWGPDHPALAIGQPVPGREGWIFTQLVESDQHGGCWLTHKEPEKQDRIVRLAWTAEGLEQLRREAEVRQQIKDRIGTERGRFSNLTESQFARIPYLLEIERTGINLYTWATARGGLNAIPESVRVRVAAKAAAALDALHRVGLVHGDLGPEAIFISGLPDGASIQIDGFGTFGPSQASAELAEGPTQLAATQTPGKRRRQPAVYLAPELENSDLATQSGDIYALGLLLYQLISPNLKGGPMPGWENQVPDIVLREDILSTANTNISKRIESAATLATALRDIAERRLASEQLAASRVAEESAKRALASELAKRPLRIALMLTLCLLIVMLAAGAWLRIRSLRIQRDGAVREAKKMRAVQDFFQALLFDGDAAAQGPITSQVLAERGLEKSRLLENEKDVHSDVLHILGGDFEALGDTARAESALNTALEERRLLYGADSYQVAETLIQQAALKEDEHKLMQARALAESALAIQHHKLPPDDIDITRSEVKLAEILTEMGDYSTPTRMLEKAIQRETGHPELLDDLSTAYNDMSIVENDARNLPKSLQFQEKSLEIDRQLRGEDHPDIAENLMTLSNDLDEIGQYTQAASEAKEALGILDHWLPPGHHDLAAAQAHVGMELVRSDTSLAEARVLFEKALATLEHEKERSSTEAYAEIGLARLDLASGRDNDALTLYRRSLAIYRQLYPKPNAAWTSSLMGMAGVFEKQQRWQQVADTAGQAYSIAAAIMTPDDPQRLNPATLLARALRHLGRNEEAAALLRDVIAHAISNDAVTKSIRDAAQDEMSQLGQK